MTADTTARFRYDSKRRHAVQAKAAAEGRSTASDVVRELLDGWLDSTTTSDRRYTRGEIARRLRTATDAVIDLL